jgi:hypothetical protein
MTIQANLAKRFAELDAQSNALRRVTDSTGLDAYDTTESQQWATSAMHIIQVAFGTGSAHYQNFAAAYAKNQGWKDHVDILKGIFRAAKADYEGGYAISLQTAISGEIFGDFVVMAKTALGEGAKDAAAVLACAALEDALKRFALLNDLDVTDKTMSEVVSALKSKGLVGGAQKSLLEAMPKVRNSAMHADWDKITAQDVGSVIGFVEQLLLTKFS